MNKVEDEQDRRNMSLDATARLFMWVKTTDLPLPPQVSMDLGIIIGRLRVLENAGSFTDGKQLNREL